MSFANPIRAQMLTKIIYLANLAAFWNPVRSTWNYNILNILS